MNIYNCTRCKEFSNVHWELLPVLQPPWVQQVSLSLVIVAHTWDHLCKLFSSSTCCGWACGSETYRRKNPHPFKLYQRGAFRNHYETAHLFLWAVYLNFQAALLKHKSFFFPPHPTFVPHGFALRDTKTVFPISLWWEGKQKLDDSCSK